MFNQNVLLPIMLYKKFYARLILRITEPMFHAQNVSRGHWTFNRIGLMASGEFGTESNSGHKPLYFILFYSPLCRSQLLKLQLGAGYGIRADLSVPARGCTKSLSIGGWGDLGIGWPYIIFFPGHILLFLALGSEKILR